MVETLSDIGEFGLIERIHKLLQKIGVHTPGVSLEIGDDAASLKPRPGFELLITCDTLIEGRHYLPRHITPVDIGRRAMAINISDIGAMGGKPLCALISLGLQSGTLVADVEDMYRGFVTELNPLGASIVGGNLTKTENTVFIDITMIGEVRKENLMLRSTAQPGDAILVTGYPGQAAAGLNLLQNAKAYKNLHAHPLVKAYNLPAHRALEGQAVARSQKAHAMIDTSDGFLADLGHICQESHVGALLIQENLPISSELKEAAVEMGMDSYQLFLQESDDYELIITCSPKQVLNIRSAIKEISQTPIHEVGRIRDASEGIELMLPDGTKRPISLKGWDHFK
ncbi:MAG: thiamine-phosphate kinase [Candidatus Aminicenantes bacterium]|nr:MAG: thiamine-phosphate kinase [Candidatus Aminicenantes bacterium]